MLPPPPFEMQETADTQEQEPRAVLNLVLGAGSVESGGIGHLIKPEDSYFPFHSLHSRLLLFKPKHT